MKQALFILIILALFFGTGYFFGKFFYHVSEVSAPADSSPIQPATYPAYEGKG